MIGSLFPPAMVPLYVTGVTEISRHLCLLVTGLEARVGLPCLLLNGGSVNEEEPVGQRTQ